MTLRRGAGLVLIAVAAGACAHAKPSDRPWVRRLVLHGVHHVDERDLKRHLVTEETARVVWADKKPFDPFALKLDVATIEAYYRAHGFYDARVTATDVNPADKPHAVNVEIFIDEGAATKIEKVKVVGLDLIGDDAKPIRRNLDLRRGQIFDSARYEAEKGEMRQRMRTLGYAWAEVHGDVVVDRDHHVADVTLTTDPGFKATVRNIDVEGAYEVDRKLYVKHSLLREGTLLTPEAIESARARLYNLGYLSSVRIDYHHNALHPEQADVKLILDEGKVNEWRLGLGLTLELQRSEIRGRAEYTRYHWLGGLRRLRLRFEPAYVFVPAFWNPLKQGPAGTVEAELTQLDLGLPPDEIHAVAGYDLGVEYAFQYHGPRASVGYARNFFHDRLQVSAAYDFQYVMFFGVDPAFTADPAVSARDYGFVDPYRLAWLEQGVTLDLRDQPLDTRRGGWFNVRAEEGGTWTGGAFDYEKIVAEVRGYYPLFGRLVVAARTEFGHIFSQGAYGSPTTRRFYLGGPESHRGFNFNRLSLQIPSGTPGNPALPIGGDEMFLTQIELRVRAVRIYGAWLEFAGFLDAGDVAAPSGMPHDHIDLTELNVAVGGGLRYKTAVGTIRADVGVRLNRLSD
ncbi:MAG TPA: POTRA domain-containing protein, partial [Polyangia bacterium]